MNNLARPRNRVEALALIRRHWRAAALAILADTASTSSQRHIAQLFLRQDRVRA